MLVTAFLVFFMQAGFMMLEGGFARTREVSNVMIECIVDTGLCGLLFYAFGFAFMFGTGNGWIGYHYFFLQGVPHTYTATGAVGVSFMAFFLFQFAFADTASTIVSGAMVGRTAFKGDLLYSVVVSGFIYPIFGHWVWGPNGWLGKVGARTSLGRRSVTSPAQRWCTPSAACSPSWVPGHSARGSAASSSVTVVACRRVTT